MAKCLAAIGIKWALVLCGAIAAASCGKDTSPPSTVKAPPGVTAPTTQEVMAQLEASKPKQNLSDLEAIPDLGEQVSAQGPDGKQWQKYPSGIMLIDDKIGQGALPKLGQRVAVAYVGTLPGTGKEFDRSPAGQPLEFFLGTKSIIKGWNIAVSTMKVGGKRRVWIPAKLAYGVGGSPPKIGPNQPLIFDMELKSVTGEPVKLPPPASQPATSAAPNPATAPGALPASAPAAQNDRPGCTCRPPSPAL